MEENNLTVQISAVRKAIGAEAGVIIESTEMASQLVGMRDPDSEYRLRLSGDGRVECVGLDPDGMEAVFDAPPETNRWLRFKLWLLSPIVPKDELRAAARSVRSWA